ncbi:hypothetical protein ACFE04_003610 [Oxalis oulophora]
MADVVPYVEEHMRLLRRQAAVSRKGLQWIQNEHVRTFESWFAKKVNEELDDSPNRVPDTIPFNSSSLEESIGGCGSGGDNLCRQASSGSFSSGNKVAKRERELIRSDDQEIDIEKVACNDEDEYGRKKLRLNKDQSAFLEERFKEHSTLNPKQKQALARQLNLRPRQVEVWFQNRRARTKLKQTEVDCEFLKKCCETLTDENRRLQKELQELKALKLSQPFYMHMPTAATLAICPSCEKLGGGGGGSDGGDTSASDHNKSHFPMAHLYNSFTNHSAAC